MAAGDLGWTLEPDDTVLAAAVSGDRGARGELARRFHSEVEAEVGYLLRGSNGLGQAVNRDDMRQEVWCRILEDGCRKLTLFDPRRGCLATFLRAIAKSVVGDFKKEYRRESSRRSVTTVEALNLAHRRPGA